MRGWESSLDCNKLHPDYTDEVNMDIICGEREELYETYHIRCRNSIEGGRALHLEDKKSEDLDCHWLRSKK